VIQQSYLLTVDVKSLALTQSQNHVTSKSLIVITSDDQVYSIENSLFTARRQTKDEADALAERTLEKQLALGAASERNLTDTLLEIKSNLFPPYDGIISKKNTKYISYDLDLVDLREIITLSTRLESTTGVLAVGHDIFFSRFMPEGNFDRLHENFKAPLLFAVIVVLVLGLYSASLYVKSKEKRDTFLKK